MKTLIRIAVVSLTTLALNRESLAAPIYELVDIGSLTGLSESYAYGINESGQVVGYASAQGSAKGFLYDNGKLTFLGGLVPGGSSNGRDINASGQVTGSATYVQGIAHAMRYEGGVMTDLGTFPEGKGSIGYGINDSGEVAGYASSKTGRIHAAYFHNGTVTDLGVFTGGTQSVANDINNSGQIAGYSSIGSASINHAFVYANGVMQDLGTLPGQAQSVAYGINNLGQVTGYSYNNQGPILAFVWSSGVMAPIGVLPNATNSFAWGINDKAQIVGDSNPNSTAHGFLYSDGVIMDLNNLLDSTGTGWVVTEAQAINNKSWIVGTARNAAGDTHAVLLMPVPEPAALTLAITGTLGLLACRARRRFVA